MTNLEFNNYFKNYADAEILYNKLDFANFSVENFNKHYTIGQLRYTSPENDYINFEAKILNSLIEKNTILSVSFVGGKSLYFLVEKNTDIDFSDVDPENEFVYSPMIITEEDKNTNHWKMTVAFNLLLNALAKHSKDSSNLNGHFYSFVTKEGSQIITICYFAKNGILYREQQSFIPYKYYTPQKNVKAPTKYLIKRGTNNSRILFKAYYEDITDDNREEIYIKKSFKKYEVPYDHLSLSNKNSNTRINILHRLISDFNSAYKNIAKLEFCKINAKAKRIKSVGNIKEEKINNLKGINQLNLVITGDINSNHDNIKRLLDFYKSLDLEVTLSSDIDPKIYNIAVIHEKKYYEDSNKKDIKLEFPRNAIIQCITIENIDNIKKPKNPKNPEKAEKKVRKRIADIGLHLLNELLIKKELKEKKIERWKHGNFEFYLGLIHKSQLGEEPKHLLMRIHDDGKFEIIENPEEIGIQYTKHILELKNKKDKYKNGNICIVRKGKDFNQIQHTEYIPIMDMDNKNELEKKSGDASYTTRCKKQIYLNDKMTYPYVGKIVMVLDDMIHYTVGYENEIQQKIAKVNNIYSIKLNSSLDDNEEISSFIPEILDMLEDYYIRSNNTETVRPYPFKYLMEYIRIQNPGADLYFN